MQLLRLRGLILALLTLVVIYSPGAFSRPQITDVVFDIDWTLFYTLPSETPPTETSTTTSFGGKVYKVSDHALDVLIELQRQGVRLSTFSGGSNERNSHLIDWLKNQALTQKNFHLRFFKNLSFQDLTVRSTDPQLKFAQRYGKDLTKINPDLTSIVLVDDMASFAMKGQERNVIHLKKTFNDIADYDLWNKTLRPFSKEPQYDPATYKDWLIERNKLLWAEQVLSIANVQTNPISSLQNLITREQCRYLFFD